MYEGMLQVMQKLKYIDFNCEKLTFNKWGQRVTGWSTIRIYCWAVIKGSDKTLNEVR